MFLVTNIRIKDKEKFAVFSGIAGSAIRAYFIDYIRYIPLNWG